MSHPDEVVPKEIDGALEYNDTFKRFKTNVMSNYFLVRNDVSYITGRTYELPYRWFLLTFKPFNRTYDDNFDFYQNKCIDHCRKKLGKVAAYIITREIKATKTHVNILCVTKRALSIELHEKKTNRYFIYCKEAYDRHICLEYILKESRTRNFTKYIDYAFFHNNLIYKTIV